MVARAGRGRRSHGHPDHPINGEDYSSRTPDALVAKIKEIVGDVPGLEAARRRHPHRHRAPTAGRHRHRRHDRCHAQRRPAERTRGGRVERVSVRTASAVWVLIAGVVGLAAALTLTVEKIEMLINPDYVPSCSINPVLSCGSVMVTPQASAFGFPNPLIGIVAFTVVVVTGVLAVAKVALPRWYWVGLAAGTLLGVVFMHWLIFQSLYRIGALCPYCMVVWAVTIPLFVVVASIALQPAGTVERGGAGALHVALVAGGAVVHRADSADSRAVLELLVDSHLEPQRRREVKDRDVISKVLVANRGEIAIRAFRAAYEMGIATVAVYPYEDRNSLHRLKADESYQIGETGHPVRAYLSVDEIVRVARQAGADAIYPGYGFLSENPELAAACAAAGITFVGPSAEVLELTGNKSRAIAAARAAGLPVLASSAPSASVDELVARRRDDGVSVVRQGGVRRRRARHAPGHRPAPRCPRRSRRASREAESAFGDPTRVPRAGGDQPPPHRGADPGRHRTAT